MSSRRASVSDLNSVISAGDCVLIDVRTPVEYTQVHVAQAINVPLDELSQTTLHACGALSPDRPVYVICHSGQRAAKAASKLAALGCQQALVVEGGTQAWLEAGLPVIRGGRKVISLERQVRIAAGLLVFTGVILSRFVHPGFVWMSGFVGAGLVFAGIADFCGMGLVIAKLPWNRRKD